MLKKNDVIVLKINDVTLDGSGEFEIVYNGQSRLVSLDGKKDVDF